MRHVDDGVVGHWRIHIRGTNGIDRNVLRDKFHRQRARQTEHAVFRCRVRSRVLAADFARNGRDVDDASPIRVHHHRRDSFGDVIDRIEIRVHNFVPQRVVVSQKFVRAAEPRVIDQNGNVAQLRADLFHRVRNRVGLCDIADNGKCVSPIVANFLCDDFNIGQGARGNRNRNAALRERQCNRFADAFARAGDPSSFHRHVPLCSN